MNDAEECNGKFKFWMKMAKEEILKKRIQTFTSDLEIMPYDIIPIINTAWSSSFAQTTGCSKAISYRGWNPLNRNLLLHETLRDSMTEEDKQWEMNSGLFPSVRHDYIQQREKQHTSPHLPSM